MTIEITYHPEYRDDATDAVFYPDLYDSIAKVIDIETKRGLVVIVVGQTRADVWPSTEARQRYDEPTRVTSIEGWNEVGLTTDAALADADDKGRIEWENNSWFEVRPLDNNYDADERWCEGLVFHSVEDAASSVREYLEQQVSHDGTVDGAVCSDHPDILLSDGCYKCDPDDYVLIDGVYVNRLTLDDFLYEPEVKEGG